MTFNKINYMNARDGCDIFRTIYIHISAFIKFTNLYLYNCNYFMRILPVFSSGNILSNNLTEMKSTLRDEFRRNSLSIFSRAYLHDTIYIVLFAPLFPE